MTPGDKNRHLIPKWMSFPLTLQERRSHLMDNVPTCPKCGSEVKLKCSSKVPAKWQCTKPNCHRKFEFEPK